MCSTVETFISTKVQCSSLGIAAFEPHLSQVLSFYFIVLIMSFILILELFKCIFSNYCEVNNSVPTTQNVTIAFVVFVRMWLQLVAILKYCCHWHHVENSSRRHIQFFLGCHWLKVHQIFHTQNTKSCD